MSMFTRLTDFFDRLKSIKNHLLRKRPNEKLMEWKSDVVTLSSNQSLFEDNVLKKSKSDMSIDSVDNCDLKNSSMNNLSKCENNVTLPNDSGDDDNDDDDEVEVKKSRLLSVRSYLSNYNLFRYDSNEDQFKTQEKDSNRIVYFGKDILDFQGNMHSPDEIALYWKKDCRTWLWKSVRLAKKRRRMQITTVITQIDKARIV